MVRWFTRWLTHSGHLFCFINIMLPPPPSPNVVRPVVAKRIDVLRLFCYGPHASLSYILVTISFLGILLITFLQ